MSNLLIEIGNTAVKASWSDRMTLGKTFRYQGEKYMDFILSLTAREKPAVMVFCSAFPFSEQEVECLKPECGNLLVLDRNHRDLLLRNGLPSYLSYDRAASVAAARYLFKGRGCTIVDFGTTLTIDFISSDGTYSGGNINPDEAE